MEKPITPVDDPNDPMEFLNLLMDKKQIHPLDVANAENAEKANEKFYEGGPMHGIAKQGVMKDGDIIPKKAVTSLGISTEFDAEKIQCAIPKKGENTSDTFVSVNHYVEELMGWSLGKVSRGDFNQIKVGAGGFGTTFLSKCKFGKTAWPLAFKVMMAPGQEKTNEPNPIHLEIDAVKKMKHA